MMMRTTYLKDYLARHPNAKLNSDGYPVDTQSAQGFVLCVQQAGYAVKCILGDHPDCRDCWNSACNNAEQNGNRAGECCFGEQYPGVGSPAIGCTQDNVWCNDAIAAACKMYLARK